MARPNLQRRLVTITGQPTTEQIQLPRFEATVDPDIYLIGFGLTADQAIGVHVAQWLPRGALDLFDRFTALPDANLGWFRVMLRRSRRC